MAENNRNQIFVIANLKQVKYTVIIYPIFCIDADTRVDDC